MESIIRTTPVTGRGWTTISKVNVRTIASVRGGWVTRILQASTEVEVTAEVMNSSGEIWYAVRLYQGYVGYIRGDLLRVDIRPVETRREVVNVQESGDSNVVIYVVVDPSLLETGTQPKVVYITPDQAAEMGIG